MTPPYFFLNDYAEGGHPQIIEALGRANQQQEQGYGLDSFTQQAVQLLREKIKNSEAAIHFVSSGTQANVLSIASLLKPYESVIAADLGHISVNETGAVEATGHKVNTVPAVAGKINLGAVKDLLAFHADEHKVKPAALYLSQATELGTIYSKEELAAIYQFCQENNLYLYIDGARLGQALASLQADFSLEEIARSCDIFTIGGTKNGALLGEAIVVINPALQKNFRYHLKQRGALLAKGRIFGLQFQELFTHDLFFKNAQHANKMAALLAEGVRAAGYSFLHEPVTNQLFPIFPLALAERLQQKYQFYLWSRVPTQPEATVARLVTSWATEESAVAAFLKDLREFVG